MDFFLPSLTPGVYRQSSVEPQNKNNNACTAADSNKSSSTDTKQSSQPEQQKKLLKNKSKGDKKEEKILETKIKETSITYTNSVKEDKQGTTAAVKSNVDMQNHSKSAAIKPDPMKSNAQPVQEKKPVPPPTSEKTVSAERDEELQRVDQNNLKTRKITPNVTSRFGMKTFTVVPPKPSVVHTATGVPAVALTDGAIKIDDQGNMVKASISQNKVGASSESGINHSEGSPLLGKAKAFWSSNERQESAVSYNKAVIDKAKESTDGLKSTPTTISENTLKTGNTEDLKTTQASFNKPAERVQPKVPVKEEAKEPAKDVKVAKEQWEEVESKISVSKNVQQPSIKPSIPSPLLPDLRKDLSFLKPSRRTSSQYVASAIAKYTPKTSVKPNFIPNAPDSSASLKTQTFQRSGRSIQVNPHQSSQSSLSDNKENESAFKFNPPGPKRSMSFPEYVSDSQRDFEEVRPDRGGFGSSVGSIRGSTNALETETTKNKHIQSSGPTQINTTANNDKDNIKHIHPRSPSPAQSSPHQSSAKPPTAPKIIPQIQTSVSKACSKFCISSNGSLEKYIL